ncbi:MAG: hypothetical protein L7T23_02745 [Alphaproteobacteria bacterium]|nr:hypothetical protein [Alphaproteobacteria bacterium]
MTKKNLPEINLDDWGTFEEGMPKVKKNISLIPVGKDGKEIEWYGRSWAGVIDYAKALGLKYTDVGSLLENTYGDRTSFQEILFAQEVHKSLEMVDYYRRPRLKMAPSGTESKMHYAIRMQQAKIFKLYAKAGGKAKDKFKGAAALYSKVYKKRKSMVEAYLHENKQTSEQAAKTAEAVSKALGTEKVFRDIFKKEAVIKKKKK